MISRSSDIAHPALRLHKYFNRTNSTARAATSAYADTPTVPSAALQSSNLQSSIVNTPSPAPGANFPTRSSPPLPAPTLRPDLASIAEMIPAGAGVLDLGCGEGELLEYLVRVKQAKGRGIELSETGVLACVRRGLSVRQGNLQEGLADYPDASFDYVTLAQTLPYLDDPSMILHEMLRVGRRGVISFPNWGYWRCRLQLLLTGRMPPAPDLPQEWFDIPRWQAFTVTDFARYCRELGIQIDQQIYLANETRISVRKYKNLLATTAIFGLSKRTAPREQK